MSSKQQNGDSKKTVNETQWGHITILNGENYTIFENQARKALATAGCLRLIDGTAAEPGEEPGSSNSVAYKRWERDYNEYREKRKNAIKIISTSIDDS
ncbi:hypothetical protein K3495_g14707, partial [Podosphaera aphanis]